VVHPDPAQEAAARRAKVPVEAGKTGEIRGAAVLAAVRAGAVGAAKAVPEAYSHRTRHLAGLRARINSAENRDRSVLLAGITPMIPVPGFAHAILRGPLPLDHQG
jgi:hypothetical protein